MVYVERGVGLLKGFGSNRAGDHHDLLIASTEYTARAQHADVAIGECDRVAIKQTKKEFKRISSAGHLNGCSVELWAI